MFERLTEAARSVVVLATSTARATGNPEVEPLHLLHALAATCEDGLVGKLLATHRADPARLNEAIQARRGTEHPTGHRPFSGESKAALEAALRSALQTGSARIECEHLLVGTLAQDGLRAALTELDVQVSALIEGAASLARTITAPTTATKRARATAAAADGLALLAEAFQLLIEEVFGAD